MITDCHIHIQPWRQLRPDALALMRQSDQKRQAVLADAGAPAVDLAALMDDPAAFLAYLDRSGVERAVLINYTSELLGFTEEVNDFVARYCAADLQRLIPCGSVPPQGEPEAVRRGLDHLLHLGIRMIKIHPPHQNLHANDYLRGVEGLRIIYATAEREGLPVMVHTGTSVFPGARNRFGHPLDCDDVAVDFPRLKLLLAHGGRPLWMDEAFFLVRRHPNVYLDISGIPPRGLLDAFPRLEEIADKTLFGSDWPGPGVPDIGMNLRQIQALPLAQKAQQAILSGTADRLLGRP
jgi:predicted TIM-barrel fold metal-dependent hydrolase